MKRYSIWRVGPYVLPIIFLCSVLTSVAWGQSSEFHNKVNKLYSYEPQTLSAEAQKAKSDELDTFWAYVKENLPQRLPLLLAELRNPANSPFFFYDASKLLLSLSKDPLDQQLALDSLPKADLRGVQHADYLRTIHRLACLGYDTTPAALRILDYPDFKAFIPQHALTLGQDYSFIYMLFPLEERHYLDPLIQRVAVEQDVVAQKSLLLALWYSMSAQGTAAIRRFADTTGHSLESRTYAEQLLKRQAPVLGYLSVSSSARLKEERQQVMRRPISDEALIDFDSLTAKLLTRQ